MYALKYYKQINGSDSWFEKMSDLGPIFNTDISKAARFDSESDAADSPGFRFATAPVTIEEVRP